MLCTVGPDLYDNLHAHESHDRIVHEISTVLVTCFSTADFDETRILTCIRQAIEQGENMLMKFKEKVSAKRKAVIFLRYLDTCRFHPLLRVYDSEDHLLFEMNLPETILLDCLGEIQVSAKQVKIKPRKNAYTKHAEPMVFDY